MRGKGRVWRPRTRGQFTNVWWTDFSVRGRRYRFSTRTTNRTLAERILQEQRGAKVLEAFQGSGTRSALRCWRCGGLLVHESDRNGVVYDVCPQCEAEWAEARATIRRLERLVKELRP